MNLKFHIKAGFRALGFHVSRYDGFRIRRLTRAERFQDRYHCQLANILGFKMFADSNDSAVGIAIVQGGYERHVTRVIESILRPGSTFLDLGANIGYYTLLAAGIVGEKGRVIAVEPNPKNVKFIRASVLENHFRNVTVYPVAASDTERTHKFTTVDSNGGIITTPSHNQPVHLLVKSKILDRLLQNEPRIDVIKIDIEAHESQALRGMERLIRKHKPMIVTEFHPWAIKLNCPIDPEDYLKQIIGYGYRLSIIRDEGLVSVPDTESVMRFWESLNQETIHLDLLCVDWTGAGSNAP